MGESLYRDVVGGIPVQGCSGGIPVQGCSGGNPCTWV